MSKKKLLEYDVLDDTGNVVSQVVIETEDDNPSAPQLATNAKGIQKATQDLQQSLDSIRPTLHAIAKSLQEINQPKEVSVEVGLKLSAKAGVIVASLDSEINFKVTLKWVN
jgi:prefoldin subunit 5